MSARHLLPAGAAGLHPSADSLPEDATLNPSRGLLHRAARRAGLLLLLTLLVSVGWLLGAVAGGRR